MREMTDFVSGFLFGEGEGRDRERETRVFVWGEVEARDVRGDGEKV